MTKTTHDIELITTSVTYGKLVIKIKNWAEERNLIKGSTPIKQLQKLKEEVGELEETLTQPGYTLADVILEIGDILVVLLILCFQLGLTTSNCLAAAYFKIKDRKGILHDGIFYKENEARYDEIIKLYKPTE